MFDEQILVNTLVNLKVFAMRSEFSSIEFCFNQINCVYSDKSSKSKKTRIRKQDIVTKQWKRFDLAHTRWISVSYPVAGETITRKWHACPKSTERSRRIEAYEHPVPKSTGLILKDEAIRNIQNAWFIFI